jgi:hypothetical protein
MIAAIENPLATRTLIAVTSEASRIALIVVMLFTLVLQYVLRFPDALVSR